MDKQGVSRKSISQFPHEPGVYLMKDSTGKIIYVGKAKVLINRVRSYFSGGKDIKTSLLMKKVAQIDYIITQNQYEALILENNLIKRWKPRYNINLKDGKTYPVIRITADEYPRVFRTRRIVQDGSEYFGPYPDVQSIDTYLELIERLFPLRKCRGPLKHRDHPCLYFHIGRCAAPCADRIDREGYLAHVDQIRELLSGRTETLIADLERRMRESAEALRYEKAAELRDSIEAIRTLAAKQQVVDTDLDSRDYAAFAAKEELATFVVFQMRNGKLLGSDIYRTQSYATEEEDLQQFFTLYYDARRKPPAKLFVPISMDTSAVSAYFLSQHNEEVLIATPAEGRDSSIMRMAVENARQDLEKRIRERGNRPALEELQTILKLPRLPMRIEGFDIAQLSGKHTVASMVSFLEGVPDKGKYRRFHIKTLEGAIDDFASMREVVARRYTRVVNEKLPEPDLILIDGGKGQIGAATGVLEALGLSIPVIGLAKKNEEIFLPGKSEPILLPFGSAPLRVIQSVRDEAHRFATGFNQGLRKKDITLGLLERVPGIGPKRSRKLLEEFETITSMIEASPEKLAAVAGIGKERAGELQETLRNRMAPGASGLEAAESPPADSQATSD
ncbi:MAG TPA: excinuclease ABC subunit UvrC [Spirochaetia bacterium]|nr:excinuclease ABC subunit UvrC [Spirochaetia bacterium]